MSNKLMLPGRIVQGHPIKRQPRTDDKGQPIMGADSQPSTQVYFALAVPKAGEQDWKTTEWGQQVAAEGFAGYPNGQTQRPDFSWKIEDGDSTIPNKNGKINAQREGFPGHWVIKCTTQLSCPCFPAGKYSPFDAIQDPNAVKCGDYFTVAIECKNNTNNGAPAQTPGVYMNPTATVFTRAGAEIIGEGAVDGNALFGHLNLPAVDMSSAAPQQAAMPPAAAAMPPAAAAMPQQAAMPPAAAPAPQQAVQPAHDLVAPAPPVAPMVPGPDVVKNYEVNGQLYTEEQLRAAGYTDAHFATMSPV